MTWMNIFGIGCNEITDPKSINAYRQKWTALLFSVEDWPVAETTNSSTPHSRRFCFLQEAKIGRVASRLSDKSRSPMVRVGHQRFLRTRLADRI